MTTPTTQKGINKFIGLVNYYCDIWARLTHTIEPLTNLIYNKVRFKWNEVKQKVFKEIMQITKRDNLLAYPD